MIKIVGLGPGSEEDLTLRSINIIKSGNNVYLRTEKHPNVGYLKNMGIDFKTFDKFYEEGSNFDEVYEKIAREIVEAQDVVYVVPGHPLVAEKSVQLIIKYAEQKNIDFEIIPALSFIDAVINSLKFDPSQGLKIIDGLQMDFQKPDTEVGNIITQIYNRFTASEIKLSLMEIYSDEQEVILIRAAGVKGLEKTEKMPLYMIDRVDWIDYLTSLYIPPVKDKIKYNFKDLLEVMDKLRSDTGCPWDREQTHESLKRYLVEECYEALEAIDNNDIDAMCEELGDVLLQVVFHSQIAKEFGEFDISDVIHVITDKMIKRHTHVFGDIKLNNSDEVLMVWEKNKLKEKNIKTFSDNLKAIPESMPALMKSYKVLEKTTKLGHEFETAQNQVIKFNQEIKELLGICNNQCDNQKSEEIGDLLFAIVNISRYLAINPEFTLTNVVKKFITRFEYAENLALSRNKDLTEMTSDELIELWHTIKIEKNK